MEGKSGRRLVELNEQTAAARRPMSAFLEHGQMRMVEVRLIATDASSITKSSVVVPVSFGEVVRE